MTLRQDEEGKWRMGIEHHQIHDGVHFSAWKEDETMADGETINIVFKTPNSEDYIHMLVEWASKVGGHLEIWESPSWTRGGAGGVQSIMNSQRNSSNTSGLLENESQTAFNANSRVVINAQSVNNNSAANIFADYVFGAVAVGGGERRQSEEIVLKSNTTYAVIYIADGNSNAGFVKLTWYEYKINE